MRNILLILALLIVVNCSKHTFQYLNLPSIIGEGMVLQQNSRVNLWGNTAPMAEVQIVTGWGEKTKVRADEEGQWLAAIKTTVAGGPYQLAFSTSDTSITIENVMLGEVWFCSGQSNMEMPLSGWPPNDSVNNSAKEIASADFPKIRLFTFPRKVSIVPSTGVRGSWQECSPETIGNFSATAYFFGRKLFEELHVPIGLIHDSWGGTPAESWTSEEYLKGFAAYAGIVDQLEIVHKEYDTLINWMKSLQSDTPENNDTIFYKTLIDKIDGKSAMMYDVSSWKDLTLPCKWEDTVLPGFDGLVWFRKEFEIKPDANTSNLILRLGPIDDMDVVYINGVRVGATLSFGFWQMNREYKIPDEVVKPGKNVIAALVIDDKGGGGIYGDNDIVIYSVNSKKPLVSLKGIWKFWPEAQFIDGNLYFFNDKKNYFNRPAPSILINEYTPSCLYNGMIHPVVKYSIKGVIWYQGESNVDKAYEYRTLFPAMIQSWRKAWKQGDFPFYFVQIAPFIYNEELPMKAAELREAQSMALNEPNTGMVVTTDIGNPLTIHPSNKQDVGNRLALWALVKTYGFDSIVYSGPLYKSFEIRDDKIIVHFEYAEVGLMKKGSELTFFEIAGEDQIYYPAQAIIEGNTVIVSSWKVTEPVAVRFGWSEAAEPNLFNKAGLPASPFCTDHWKRMTE